MKKWKAVALSPDNERKVKLEPSLPPPLKPVEIVDVVQKENIKPDPPSDDPGSFGEPTVRAHNSDLACNWTLENIQTNE